MWSRKRSPVTGAFRFILLGSVSFQFPLGSVSFHSFRWRFILLGSVSLFCWERFTVVGSASLWSGALHCGRERFIVTFHVSRKSKGRWTPPPKLHTHLLLELLELLHPVLRRERHPIHALKGIVGHLVFPAAAAANSKQRAKKAARLAFHVSWSPALHAVLIFTYRTTNTTLTFPLRPHRIVSSHHCG